MDHGAGLEEWHKAGRVDVSVRVTQRTNEASGHTEMPDSREDTREKRESQNRAQQESCGQGSAELSRVEGSPAMLCLCSKSKSSRLGLIAYRCEASKALHGVAGMPQTLFPSHWGQNENFIKEIVHQGKRGRLYYRLGQGQWAKWKMTAES